MITIIQNLIRIFKDEKLLKGFLKAIFVIIFPMIFFTIIANIFLVGLSFIVWKLPDNGFYFPFLSTPSFIFDRILLIIGFILLLFIQDE